MTEDKDKSLPVEASADEPLGIALSNGMEEVETGACLGPEDIAAWLGGRITGEKRDKILMHLSSCDSCRETLLLAVDLQREAASETQWGVQRERSNIIRFRPLALAASLLIVIFSLYLFFKTDVPKTPGQLAERVSGPVEKKVLQSQPSAPLESDLEFSDTKTAVPVVSAGKKRGPAATGEYRLKDSGGESPGGRRIAPRKDSLKKAGETAADARTVSPPAPAEKKVPESNEAAENEETKSRRGLLGLEEKTGKPPEPSSPKLKATSAAVETETAPLPREKQEEGQVTQGKSAVSEDRSRTTSPAAFEKNLAWSQANFLNQQVQTYKAHIPAKELQDTFKQAIDLTNQLKEPFEELKNEAAAAGDSQKLEAFVQGVTPLISVKTGKGTAYIYPNIGYFLSRSVPGSVEFQFFSLARMGWCIPGGGCYEPEGEREFHFERRQEKGLGKTDAVEYQLRQWKALSPRLDGIFRDVANTTMENLKQRQLPVSER